MRPLYCGISLSNIEKNKRKFLSFLFTPFAYIVFFRNRIKQQCNKYYNGVKNSEISDVITFTLFVSLFQTQTDARLSNIKLRVRIRDRSAGDWQYLCQPSSGWLPFSNWRRMEQKKREMGLLSYFFSKMHWVSDPHYPLQPLGYAGSLYLYLSRRLCNL